MKKSLLLLGLVAVATACNQTPDEKIEPSITIDERTRTSAALRAFASCDELTEVLRANLTEEMRTSLLQYEESWRGWYGGGVDYESGAEDSAGAPSSNGGGKDGEGARQEGVNFSGTNNQEAGVDEADFVKTDGYNIYVLSGNKLSIFAVPQMGMLVPVSSIEIEGYPSSMLMSQGRVTVFSSIYTWDMPATHPLYPYMQCGTDQWGYRSCRTYDVTKLTVVDISNPAQPTVARSLYLDSYFEAARRVESSVRMVAYSSMYIPGLVYYPEIDYSDWEHWNQDEYEQRVHEAVAAAIAHNDAMIAVLPLDAFVPSIYEVVEGGAISERAFTDEDCQNFTMADDGTSRGITSILSLDLASAELGVDADHIISNWSVVYASTNSLVIAEPAQDYWWYWNNDEFEDATNIHRFDISVPGVTTYTGSGRIPGAVLDQFSLSEYEGNLRVASTTGLWGWWQSTDEQPPIENHVFVLAGEGALSVVGHVGGIGMGERLWSSRFIGNKGYLVTFRSIDPLWTIDLANPVEPKVIGELQVPGVSTYIHPIGDSHLLTIGYGSDDAGRMDWSTQVSLFDVTDFAHPLIDSALSFEQPDTEHGWSWSYSEATWNHLAFQFWAPLGLLAVPLSMYRVEYASDSDGYYEYDWDYNTKLQLVKVDTEAGQLSSFGAIDHSAFYNDENNWWAYQDVRRSIFMHDEEAGDFVYAISDRGITAHRLPDLTLVSSAELPGTSSTNGYWMNAAGE